MRPIKCLFLLKSRGEPYTPTPPAPKSAPKPTAKDERHWRPEPPWHHRHHHHHHYEPWFEVAPKNTPKQPSAVIKFAASAPGGWQNRTFTGLQNSIRYVVDMLIELGIEASYARVDPTNQAAIQAAITAYGPTHCIVEAIWLPPTTLAALVAANPNVKFDVRLHSELPFFSEEKAGIEWTFAYAAIPGVTVSANEQRLVHDISAMIGKPVPWTPNYYPLLPLVPRTGIASDNFIDISCFGAIRPLKNQFIQAAAALQFAAAIKRPLRFHVNSDRVEMGAAPILNAMKVLFANSAPHQLVLHPWMDTASFINLIRTQIDVGMQVSFSETFNIVIADHVGANVSVVVSPEIFWVNKVFQADPTSTTDMVLKLQVAWAARSLKLHQQNYDGLMAYDAASEQAWPIALRQM